MNTFHIREYFHWRYFNIYNFLTTFYLQRDESF